MTRRVTTGSPAAGAVRCHKLAPAAAEDAFEYAAGLLRRRGWTVIEEGFSINGVGGEYLMVDLWAIPPRPEVAEVATA